MLKKLITAGAVFVIAMAGGAHAETWTLDPETSRVSFGSIKKDKVGEVHSFSGLLGAVTATGEVKVFIDLATVETNIDIRNERMIEHVFKGAGVATLTAAVDMAALNALAVGESAVTDVVGSLNLVGTDVEIDTEMFVARISETRVLATTNDMIFLSTEEAGITAGIDKLMELAKLPGITRAAPVTLRLVFEASGDQADAAPAAAPAAAATAAATEVAAAAGDPKAGKKVFRKCKACHKLDEGKNGVGPSLYGIIGSTAGEVEGYTRYSDAMKASGIVWTTDALREFLANPKGVVKGTKMSFRGLKKPEDIENLLAYLAAE